MARLPSKGQYCKPSWPLGNLLSNFSTGTAPSRLPHRTACRGDSSGRQISSADSASIALNARSYARMHDSGQTVDTPDSSRHIRPHSDRSAHGGGAFYSMHGNGAAFDALNEEREAEAEATARNSMQASRPSMQGERGLQPNA